MLLAKNSLYEESNLEPGFLSFSSISVKVGRRKSLMEIF